MQAKREQAVTDDQRGEATLRDALRYERRYWTTVGKIGRSSFDSVDAIAGGLGAIATGATCALLTGTGIAWWVLIASTLAGTAAFMATHWSRAVLLANAGVVKRMEADHNAGLTELRTRLAVVENSSGLSGVVIEVPSLATKPDLGARSTIDVRVAVVNWSQREDVDLALCYLAPHRSHEVADDGRSGRMLAFTNLDPEHPPERRTMYTLRLASQERMYGIAHFRPPVDWPSDRISDIAGTVRVTDVKNSLKPTIDVPIPSPGGGRRLVVAHT